MENISLDVALDVKEKLIETFGILEMEVSERLFDCIDLILMDYLSHDDRIRYIMKQ